MIDHRNEVLSTDSDTSARSRGEGPSWVPCAQTRGEGRTLLRFSRNRLAGLEARPRSWRAAGIPGPVAQVARRPACWWPAEIARPCGTSFCHLRARADPAELALECVYTSHGNR